MSDTPAFRKRDILDLTNDAITRDYRIWQRRRGHRYSVDDLATAYRAVVAHRTLNGAQSHAAPEAGASRPSYADIGCGIGSVLLMVSWKLQSAQVFGVEAQQESVLLLRRNIAEAPGLASRATLIHGDLRQVCAEWTHPRCELVTGTPPYLPVGTAIASPDPQRAAARLELRGGVEAYIRAASAILSTGGLFVVCADARRPERVTDTVKDVGMAPIHQWDVITRPAAAGDNTPALFSVWTLMKGAPAAAWERSAVRMRHQNGDKTEEAQALRGCFGLPER